MLPPGQELVKLSGSDGLDFTTEASERRAMNARQDPTVAPLDFPTLRRSIMALEHLPFRFESGKRDMHVTRGKGHASGQICDRDGPGGIHPAAYDGERVIDRIAALGRYPERRSVSLDWKGSACRVQFLKPGLPGIDGRRNDQSEERIVQLIGVARIRPNLGRNLIDGGSIQVPSPLATSVRRVLRNWTARRGVLQEARHRETRMGWHSGSRVKTRKERGYRLRPVRMVPFSRPFSTPRRPSTSMASYRQFAIVSFTSGDRESEWGHRFSAQAT